MEIFIGNLDNRTKKEDLQSLFEQFGAVTRCRVKEDEHLPYGFVQMDNVESGIKAISNLNGYKLLDRKIKVEKSIQRKTSQNPFGSNKSRKPPQKPFVSQQQSREIVKPIWLPNANKGLEILNPTNTIQEQSWKQFMDDDRFLEVIVAEVFSPHNFFIQLKGNSSSLEALMDSLEEFYDANEDDYKMLESSLAVGMICASKLRQNFWYRARITSIDIDSVEVFHVDYGSKEVVRRESLCYLRKQFCVLPCQAIKAKLSGVKSKMTEWPIGSSERFLELVGGPSENGGLLASVKDVGSELSLWLVDTVTNNLDTGIQINQVMLDEEFAIPDDEKPEMNNNLTGESLLNEKVLEGSIVDRMSSERGGNKIQELVNEMRRRLSIQEEATSFPFPIPSSRAMLKRPVLSAGPELRRPFISPSFELRKSRTSSETSANSLLSTSSDSTFSDETAPPSLADHATLDECNAVKEFDLLMKYKTSKSCQGQERKKHHNQNKLFVGGLSCKTSKEMLVSHFSKYGEIVDAFVRKFPEKTKTLGFGFVKYAEEKQVDGCQDARPHVLDGKLVGTYRAIPKEEIRKIKGGVVKKILVGGLKYDDKDCHLKEYFGQFGHIVSITRITQNKTGTGVKEQFRFVEFDDYDVVDKIILKGFHEINGKKIDVTKALSKKDMEAIEKLELKKISDYVLKKWH